MHETAREVWVACLEVIRDNVSRQAFTTWFEPLRAVSLEEEEGYRKLTIQLPSQFYYEWIEQHYFTLIRKTVSRMLGPNGRLVYDVVLEKEDEQGGQSGTSLRFPARGEPMSFPPSEGQHAAGTAGDAADASSWSAGNPDEPLPSRLTFGASAAQVRRKSVPTQTNPFALPGLRREVAQSQLNPNYTFDRFIEGDCNRLARGAAWAIAQSPGGTSFNPFFVYGGVGLGKTHLVQAIGNFVKENLPDAAVLYVSSERFSNDFVQAIKQNRTAEFSMYYRQVDVLAVDDVQFLSGREKTQEEFFHIFNALHQSGKQIVLSADRPPREIKGIEERLLSRFQWGLTADMQLPEFETRIAILHRKAEDDGIALPKEVIEFVAHNIKSNIRELEGSLIRLLAYATVRKREVDLALAREALRDLIGETRVNLSIDEIQRTVCEYFRIPQDLVKAKTRKREVVQARQLAMYFCKQFTKHSLKTIGLHFGGRDHSTVIHANQTVENQIDTDPKYKEIVADIRHRISLRSR